MAVPLLAAGYLVLGAAALAVGTTGGERGARRRWGGWCRWGSGWPGWSGRRGGGGPVADRRVGVGGGLALVAAVAEEALFRRVLYDRLLRFGVVAAVAGSAVFALVHLPAYGVAAMPVDLGAALCCPGSGTLPAAGRSRPSPTLLPTSWR